MGLESVQHIADLNPANPTGADSASQGDDHLRNIKLALLHDLAGFTGAIMVTGVDGGTVNAYTLTPANAIVLNGLRMGAVFSPVITNTGPATMNISGLGVIAIKQIDGVDVTAGDLVAGRLYGLIYSGAEYRLLAPTKNYIDQLAFSAALPAQAGAATKALRTNGSVASWDNERLYRSARSSNTIIGDADGGRLIDYTAGNFTQTWSLATVLGEGFYVRLRNSSQTDEIELEAPATVSQTSSSSNSIAAGTTWTIATGLTIGAGDLVNIRRTADPFNQRIIGVVASYTPGTGALVVTPSYRIGSGTFTDWSLTTRPAANGIDGLGSYVMHPNECRDFTVSAGALVSTVLSVFSRAITTTTKFIVPPRYADFAGVASSAGSSGAKSGNANLAIGGPGGGAFPFQFSAAQMGASQDILIGAGGVAITTSGASNPGGDTSIGSLLTVLGGSSTDGGALNGYRGVSSNIALGFESCTANSSGGGAPWGGVTPSGDASASGKAAINGGPCGGSISSAGVIKTPGTSLNGAVAGSAGDAVSGTDGTGVGAGGGSTRTGTRSGAGTRGEVRIRGIA